MLIGFWDRCLVCSNRIEKFISDTNRIYQTWTLFQHAYNPSRLLAIPDFYNPLVSFLSKIEFFEFFKIWTLRKRQRVYVGTDEMYEFNTTKNDGIFSIFSVVRVVIYQSMERSNNSSTSWKKSYFDNIFPLSLYTSSYLLLLMLFSTLV